MQIPYMIHGVMIYSIVFIKGSSHPMNMPLDIKKPNGKAMSW